MESIRFETALVGRREDGTLVIALMRRLPHPLETECTGGTLLEGSQPTFHAYGGPEGPPFRDVTGRSPRWFPVLSLPNARK